MSLFFTHIKRDAILNLSHTKENFMSRLKYEKGMKLYELTLLERTHDEVTPSGKIKRMWKVQCSCGKIVIMAQSSMKDMKSCGHLGKEKRRKPPGVGASKNLFRVYRGSARKLKLSFNITYDQFLSLVTGACHYCGDINPQFHKGRYETGFAFCGLGRIDNTKGYELSNIRTCCHECSWMKSDMSEQDFANHLFNLIKFGENYV